MAKGTIQPAEGATFVTRPLRALMRGALSQRPVDVVELPDLAPATLPKPLVPQRDAGLPPVADLPPGPKLYILSGPGGGGKTTTANLLLSHFDTKGVLFDGLPAATDPGPVGLAHILPPNAVHQPASRAASSAEELTLAVLGEAEAKDPPPFTLLDCGGGSMALPTVAERNRKLFEKAQAAGVSIVMLWCWTPRVLDLALLKSWRSLGVTPSATAMVLNGAHARDGWDAYESLRQQPDYQAALRDGAAEIFIPPLRQDVALEVERKGLLFSYASRGAVPDWKRGGTPMEGDAVTELGLWAQDVWASWPVPTWVAL